MGLQKFGGIWNSEITDSKQMYWSDLERISELSGVRRVFLLARCQHGYTIQETCVQCENGYVDDMHTHGFPRGPVAYWAVSDDGNDVAYIPGRFRLKFEGTMDGM